MSGIRVCIDTNVFLNVLNRESVFYQDSKEVLNAVDLGTLEAVIPTLVIAEILTGFYTDNKDDKAEQFLSTIISNKNIEVVQLSIEIAASSAVVRAKTGMRLPDAMVMSTALHEKVDYMVTNDGNFPDSFQGLRSIKSAELAKLL
ncbi:MAG: type II toxin-antitoxin system VapC family toxin [Thermoplasmatales archaeon]|nr:type II toxin-antitoxin system VapC family toxin [Thermoplasmatales archaeon]